MKSIFTITLALAAIFSLIAGQARSQEPGDIYRLLYSEKIGDKTGLKEYLIKDSGGGYEINLKAGDIRRVIRATLDMDTVFESYHNTVTSDHVDVERHGDDLVFSRWKGDDAVKSTKSLDDEAWLGSILLLKNFVLSGEEEQLFYVTRPEDEKAVLLKAIRQGVETIKINGRDVEAVKVKFTLPDIRALFWKSHYWYRLTDGLLLKTEETRGPPGTPKAHVELSEEWACEACAWNNGIVRPGSVAER